MRSTRRTLAPRSAARKGFTLIELLIVVVIIGILAAVAIGRRQRRLALVAVWIELVGVIGIGLFTLLAPQDFADDTVWTDFGIGYGLFPLILPVLGLLWLFRSTDRS